LGDFLFYKENPLYFYRMKDLSFSFVIPVFNRPQEIRELLQSFTEIEGKYEFEIVIVEDGSTKNSKSVIRDFAERLNISYYFKKNSGPGDSRNFGMQKAKGDYYIILDSDCLLPPNYLIKVQSSLGEQYVDCFGGPDASHWSFSDIQKAIDFSMTSFISTGGVRGGVNNKKDFQPRSFNMGISKRAFEASGGFGQIHPGEDPDLSLRLKNLGFRIALFSEVFVYHKRRISWIKFFDQVKKFGLVRPILNKWHPNSVKLTYWFPAVFTFGFLIALVLLAFGFFWLILLYGIYALIAFFMSLLQHKKINIAMLSIIAIFIQFYAYGTGYLNSYFQIEVLNRNPKLCFPKLFFENVQTP